MWWMTNHRYLHQPMETHLQQHIEAAAALALPVQCAPAVEREVLPLALRADQMPWQRRLVARHHVPATRQARLNVEDV